MASNVQACRLVLNLGILLFSAKLSFASTSSVLFLDVEDKAFFKSGSSLDIALPTTSFAAASAAILGVPTSSFIDKATSQELNGLLGSDPFFRPRTLVVLSLPGIDASMVGNVNGGKVGVVQKRTMEDTKGFTSAQLANILYDDFSSTPFLSAQSETSIEKFSCAASFDCDEICKRELRKLLDLGAFLDVDQSLLSTFDSSKDVDAAFLSATLCLMSEIRKAGLAEGGKRLIASVFTAAKTILDSYPPESVQAVAAPKLVLAAVCSQVSELRVKMGEKVAAAIIVSGGETLNDDIVHQLVQVASSSSRPGRLLKESVGDVETLDDLIRTVLLLGTTILLLAAAGLSICSLCYMPITRDTLLYAGLKID